MLYRLNPLQCRWILASREVVSAGSEPRTLFNVIQFVMNDRDNRSQVSLEEAMQIMYLR